MIRRTIGRALVALVTPFLLLTTTTPAHAIVVDPFTAGISLDTYADVNSADVLTITAVGAFTGGIVNNITVALHIAGTENWTDSSGQEQVRPIWATPTAVRFSDTNTVTAQFQLKPGSTLNISYSAEVAGLAPTLFMGHCVGEVLRFFGGGAGVVKTC